MLKDSLFKIISLDRQENAINAVLELNAEDPIFKGHFPSQPVLPGACILQMLKEILEAGTGMLLILKKASSLKFIAMVNPRESTQLTFSINYTSSDLELKINATMFSGELVCFKFQGVFV